ncbi:F-box protein At4g22280-like [Triticum urartu]|uniref:At1g61320/AtMIF1 LRR domain-containing protein n=1 Tax=Triticum urartu TaxID=4572 RepID=A0A8R7PHB4_TRIUA|nr:F-box protein At4g22280-like [Triticum urartu]XP_048558004.1 F-box protein At4g22280-like [Triticum urartu]
MTSTVQSLLLSSMEQNNKPQDEDRLGALTDDILLSILGSVDLATAARTSALSTRWRSLPWLLPDLNLHVRDFLPAPCPDYPVAAGQQIYFYSQIPAQHIDEAMASLTRAARSFLRIKGSSRVSRTSLEIYLIGNYSHDIGPLVRDAIDNGMIKELDLTIADDKDYDCKGGDMLRKARDVDGFFSAYPNILPCLTRLQLYNLRFAEGDIHNVLFDCCKQLQHLSLEHCDVGDCSVWQVDAPNSVLRVLEVRYSYLKRLEVLCLPKLELLSWEAWMHCEPPLHFGYVPSLKELFLVCGADLEHSGFSLSQLLDGATEIHTLTLNFQGEKLWILPESKQLRAAFSNLRKLSIHGIYVEFDLLWTINLLEAAPSVEIFDIEVFEHPCLVLYWERVGIQRVKPSWKVAGFTSCNKWKLRELHVTNFSPLMEQHMLFVREVMDRAPNLKTVILKEDDEPCKDCEAMDALPNLVGGLFPRTKNEQETIAQQLRDNMVGSSSVKIIFKSIVSTVVF